MAARILNAGMFAIAGLLTIAGSLAAAAWPAAARADQPPVIAPFSAHYSADWKTINVGTSDLDLNAGRAHGESEKKPVDLKLADGIQDVMSIQVEVMLDLKNGNLPKSFKIVDKDEIKDFLYTLEGPARLRTPLGELDTLVVASQRAGNNRVLKMWFAPSLGYIPVQAERSRDGKLEFAMRIKTLKR